MVFFYEGSTTSLYSLKYLEHLRLRFICLVYSLSMVINPLQLSLNKIKKFQLKEPRTLYRPNTEIIYRARAYKLLYSVNYLFIQLFLSLSKQGSNTQSFPNAINTPLKPPKPPSKTHCFSSLSLFLESIPSMEGRKDLLEQIHPKFSQNFNGIIQ